MPMDLFDPADRVACGFAEEFVGGFGGLAEGGKGRAGGGAEAREGFGGGEADVEVFVGQGGGGTFTCRAA